MRISEGETDTGGRKRDGEESKSRSSLKGVIWLKMFCCKPNLHCGQNEGDVREQCDDAGMVVVPELMV